MSEAEHQARLRRYGSTRHDDFLAGKTVHPTGHSPADAVVSGSGFAVVSGSGFDSGIGESAGAGHANGASECVIWSDDHGVETARTGS